MTNAHKVKCFVDAIETICQASGLFDTVETRPVQYGPVRTWEIFLELRPDAEENDT